MKCREFERLMFKYRAFPGRPFDHRRRGMFWRCPMELTAQIISMDTFTKYHFRLRAIVLPLYMPDASEFPLYISSDNAPAENPIFNKVWDAEDEVKTFTDISRAMPLYLKFLKRHNTIDDIIDYCGKRCKNIHNQRMIAYSYIIKSNKEKAMQAISEIYSGLQECRDNDRYNEIECDVRDTEKLLQQDIRLAQEKLLKIRKENLKKLKWTGWATENWLFGTEYTVDDLQQLAVPKKRKGILGCLKNKKRNAREFYDVIKFIIKCRREKILNEKEK